MIKLIAVGEVAGEVTSALAPALEQVLPDSVQIASPMQLPGRECDRKRGQHLASVVLGSLPRPRRGDRVLGLVDVDLCAPGLNFVFGQADVDGRRALISLKRLRQEFYGLPADEALFRERTLKEAVHELGHTYGLGHCRDSSCVMRFSNKLSDTDLKRWSFCDNCRVAIGPHK